MAIPKLLSRPLTAVVLVVAVPAQPPQPPLPVPSEAALAAALPAALDAVVDLLGEPRDGSTWQCLRRAAAADTDPDVGYLLLRRALDEAVDGADLVGVDAVVAALAARFAVDRDGVALAALQEVGSTPLQRPVAIAGCLALGEAAIEAPAPAALERALAAAAVLAAADSDPRMGAWVASRTADFGAARGAYLAAAGDSHAMGRYLCLFRGDWQRGAPLFADEHGAKARLWSAEGTPVDPVDLSRDPNDCNSAAERWLERARLAEHPVARRNQRLRALHWYRQAWWNTGELEQRRAERQMARVVDLVAADDPLARVRFGGPADAAQVLLTGGEWRVDGDALVGRNSGRAARATLRHAWADIDELVIRGGIRSVDNLNFRFAVGPINVLCNWEVQPECHFYLGAQRIATTPPLLERGREHEFRIRHIGDAVLIYVDGVERARAPCASLGGTVCVYPALGSEIFVTDITVLGAIDRHTVVRGPLLEHR